MAFLYNANAKTVGGGTVGQQIFYEIRSTYSAQRSSGHLSVNELK